MPDFSVRAILSAVDSSFSSGFASASTTLGNFSQRMSSLSSNVPGAVKTIGASMMAVGAATTAMGVKSLKSYGQFEQSLNQAAVVAGGTAKDISGLSDVANKMGADLPLDAQQCADAMVEMARNGASVGQIKEQFPPIAQAATAAGADVKATAGTVQEAMNIWGDSLKSPQQAAAILVQTANASNASIEDMGQALATIGGTASNAKIGMQTITEAIGLLTNKGFSASQASLDLNHAILQMQAPSNIAKKAMDSLGVSFTDASGKLKSFPTILNELNTAMKNLSPDEKAAKLKAMFGASGMQAILPLMDSVKNKTNDAKVSWDAYAREQDKASGSTKRATASLKEQANEMQKNIGSNIEQLGGNWESLRNKSMQSVQNINGAMITNANNMLTWATNSNSATAQFIRGFIGLSPAIGQAVTGIGTFLFNLDHIINGISLVSKAFSGLFTFLAANPFVAIIAAIALVVAGLTWFFTQTKTGRAMWAGFVSWLKGLWQGLVQVASTVWNAIVQVWNGAVSIVKGAWNGIASFFSGLWSGIVAVAKSVWQGLVSFFSPLINAIASIWRGLTTIVNNVWRSFLTGMQPVISAIKNYWSALTEFYRTLWQGIVAVARVIWMGLVAVFRVVYNLSIAVWRPIIAFFRVLWTGIVAVARGIWNGLVAVFRTIVNIIRAIWRPISAFFRILWQGIVIITRTVWNQIRLYISTVFKNIQVVIRAGMAIIRTVFSAGWRVLTTVVSAVWEMITTIVSGAINAVAGIIRAITAVIRGNWSGAWNAIKGVIQTVWDTIKSVVQTGINAVQNIVQTVMNAVKSVFSTVWNAIKNLFTNGVNFIKNAMHIDLFAQGQAIMNSLLNGLKSIWTNVTNFVGGIGKWIKEHKGPLPYDEQLLIPAGIAIMSGLSNGLNSGFTDVQDLVTSVAGVIVDKVNGIIGDAQETISDARFEIPEINSERFSDSINRLNAQVQTGFNNNIVVNNSNQMDRVNTLLEKIANKDNTMVLDTGKVVAETTGKYNDNLGRLVADRDRWS